MYQKECFGDSQVLYTCKKSLSKITSPVCASVKVAQKIKMLWILYDCTVLTTIDTQKYGFNQLSLFTNIDRRKKIKKATS